MSTTEQTTTPDLRALAQQVAAARVEHAAVKEYLDELRSAWEQEHAELINAAKAAGERVKAAEDALRTAALDHLHETGDKKPLPGVSIRLVNDYLYDDATAGRWALDHAPEAVEVKHAKLRAALNALRKNGQLPDWAEEVTVEQVTLAADLSMHLRRVDGSTEADEIEAMFARQAEANVAAQQRLVRESVEAA